MKFHGKSSLDQHLNSASHRTQLNLTAHASELATMHKKIDILVDRKQPNFEIGNRYDPLRRNNGFGFLE